MNNEVFNRLTKEELTRGFHLCLKSANSHLTTAQKIAELGNYGIAISHLILGAEAAIKVLIIASKLYDYELEITKESVDISKIFKSHKAKHQEAINALSAAINLYDGFFKASYEYFTEKNNIKSPRSKESIRIIHKVQKKLEELKREDFMELWKEADYYKNRGFYVGYQDDWIAPSEFDDKIYINLYSKFSIYIGAASLAKEYLDI
jgi:AbiV family abortive infection protein